MSPGDYLFAVLYMCALVTLAGTAAVGLRRNLLPRWSGSPGRLAEVVLAVSAVVVAAELVGLFGGFTRVGLLMGVVGVGVGAWWLTRRSSLRSSPAVPPAPAPPRWALGLAIAVSAIVVLHWSGEVQDSFAHGIYRQDSTWYHLPFSAGFVQSGDTWGLLFTDPLALAPWFYPQTSELLHAVGMLASDSDFLSPLVNLGWMVLALLAGWCVGRPYGMGPATLIATALVLDSGMMQTQAGNAPSDTAGLFFLLAAVALLVNAAAPAPRAALPTRALLVAGLAGGLAIGTKMTLLAPLAALTVGLVLVTPAGERARSGAAWLVGVAIGGGYWYLRNLLHAGNPLPWTEVGPLSAPDQLSIYPRPPHSVAGYFDDPGVWVSGFVPGLVRAFGEFWPLVLLGAAAGLALSLSRRQPGLVRVLGAVGAFAAVTYAFIPVSASGVDGQPSGFETNLRYLAPAIVLGLVLLPLVPPAAAKRWTAPGLATVFVLNAVWSRPWALDGAPHGLVYVLVAVLFPVGLLIFRRRGGGVGVAAGIAVATLGAIAVLGYGEQRDYRRDRYRASLAPPGDNPGFRATAQWDAIQEWARGTSDERVGVVGPPGAFGQYVFYGEDFSNQVRYVGAPAPHGGYLPIDNCVEWRQAVNAGRYTYVVVTPASALGPGQAPQEALWMSGTRGAREILRSGPASVFRIAAPLDPGACDPDRLPPILRVPGGGFGVPGAIPPQEGG